MSFPPSNGPWDLDQHPELDPAFLPIELPRNLIREVIRLTQELFPEIAGDSDCWKLQLCPLPKAAIPQAQLAVRLDDNVSLNMFFAATATTVYLQIPSPLLPGLPASRERMALVNAWEDMRGWLFLAKTVYDKEFRIKPLTCIPYRVTRRIAFFDCRTDKGINFWEGSQVEVLSNNTAIRFRIPRNEPFGRVDPTDASWIQLREGQGITIQKAIAMGWLAPETSVT